MCQLYPEQQFPVFSAKKSWSLFTDKIWNLMAPWSFWLCEVRLVGLLFTGLPVCLPEGRILTLRCSFPFCGASTPSAGASHWSLAAQSAKHETLRHWWYISLVLQPRNKRHRVREEMERRGEWVRERESRIAILFFFVVIFICLPNLLTAWFSELITKKHQTVRWTTGAAAFRCSHCVISPKYHVKRNKLCGNSSLFLEKSSQCKLKNEEKKMDSVQLH